MESVRLNTPVKPTRDRRFSKTRFAQGLAVGLVVCTGFAYTQKDRYAYRAAELSRTLIGQENTARVESWYFSVQDRLDRLSFEIFGGSTNPFAGDEPVVARQAWDATNDFATGPLNTGFAAPDAVAPPAGPAPLVPPATNLLHSDPVEGEGVWTTTGLPHSAPDDMLMAKTFIRPDSARPYATVGILLVDKRRVRLHITGGTESPGGDLGVHGPGVIPDSDRGQLLVAWNGGFRGPHGGFGMYADGVQYRCRRSRGARLCRSGHRPGRRLSPTPVAESSRSRRPPFPHRLDETEEMARPRLSLHLCDVEAARRRCRVAEAQQALQMTQPVQAPPHPVLAGESSLQARQPPGPSDSQPRSTYDDHVVLPPLGSADLHAAGRSVFAALLDTGSVLHVGLDGNSLLMGPSCGVEVNALFKSRFVCSSFARLIHRMAA